MKKLFFFLLIFFVQHLSAQMLPGKIGFVRAPVAATSQLVKMNFYDSTAGVSAMKVSAADWNDISFDLTNSTTCVGTSAFLKYSDGTQSGIRVKITDNTLAGCAIAGYTDNGAGYPSSNPISATFPTACFRSTPFVTTSDYRIIISGLPDNAASGYKLQILASRNTATSRPATYAVGGNTGTPNPVEAMNNNSSIVVIDNITPSSNTITITGTFTNAFGYLNALILTKK